jgi:hypothetical protein
MKYKYAVTVGDQPYKEYKYFMKEERAEKWAHEASSAYVNTQVDTWEWDTDKNEWDYLTGCFTCSWADEREVQNG